MGSSQSKNKKSNPQNNIQTTKILFMGDQDTGKSNVLNRIAKVQFFSQYRKTIGMDFKIRIYNQSHKPLKLYLWDTSGAERFRNILRQYYKKNSCVLFFYDVTNEQSFKRVPYYLNQIKDYGDSKSKFILIANKIDLHSKRKVPEEVGQKFAKQNGMEYSEVSALTSQGIQQLVLKIVLMVQQNLSGQKLNEIIAIQNQQKQDKRPNYKKQERSQIESKSSSALNTSSLVSEISFATNSISEPLLKQEILDKPVIEKKIIQKKEIMKKQQKSEDQSMLCVVCLNQRKNCLNQTCLHIACCFGCGSKLEVCPICRAAMSPKKVYL